MTPTSCSDASWRCTLPFDPDRGRVGIGLNLADGSALRVALDRASAMHLAETLRDYLSEAA